MKSLAELAAIREKMKDKVVLREGTSTTRIVVGMATCGIAAGARPVLNAFVDGVNKEGLASAGALILFVIIFIVTMINLRVSKKKTHY